MSKPDEAARASEGGPRGKPCGTHAQPASATQDPGRGVADGGQIAIDVVRRDVDGRQVRRLRGGWQPAKRQAQGQEADCGVVKLPGHRDDAGHQVDWRGEVGGGPEHRRTSRARERLVMSKPPGKARVPRQPANEVTQRCRRKRLVRVSLECRFPLPDRRSLRS